MKLHKNNRNHHWFLYALSGIFDHAIQLLTLGYYTTDWNSNVYYNSIKDLPCESSSMEIIHMDEELEID